jgi:hypothetical protein
MVGDFMLEDVKRAGMLIFKVTDPAVRVSQIQTDNATASKHSHNLARSGRKSDLMARYISRFQHTA